MLLKSIAKLMYPTMISIAVAAIPAYAQLSVTGIVRPVDEVVIKSELGGLIQKIAVKEGDRVKEGQLLIELENQRQRISLELSKAGVEKANAAVEETEVLLANAEKEAAETHSPT